MNHLSFPTLSEEELELKELLLESRGTLNHLSIDEIKLTSIETDHIKLIIGRDEFLSLSFLCKEDELKKYNAISISEPSESKISNELLDLYGNSLSLVFSDVRQDIDHIIENKKYNKNDKEYLELQEVKKNEISFEQIEILKQYILNNKDKKFIVHCTVGISRSAAVGLIIEDLLNELDSKKLEEQSKIINHYRYSPNSIVYYRATGKTYKKPKEDLNEIF